MVAERWAISKRKWTINLHHHHNINKISSSSLSSSKKCGPCKRCFSLRKSPFSDASPPAVHFLLNIKWKLLKKIGPLQTLFPPLKIAISWRIAPQLFASRKILKYIENLSMCDQFSFNKMTIFINIAPLKLSMCDQFSFNKMTIFFKIAPTYSLCR